MPIRVTATAFSALLSSAVSLAAQEVDYARDVRPIFAEHCFTCHGPDESTREADLYLDDPDSLAFVVEPGDPESSMLFMRITSQHQGLRMPPATHAPPLEEEQIDVIRRWILEGAKWEPHWAYAPFRDVVVPDHPEPHPIDRFVRTRLEREGVEPSPLANRRTLIRRVSLDLIGMTPTPEEIAAFLEDRSDGAYEQLVDQLLASPHYAERWARHWLDLARYADSNGFTIDGQRSMWPYRDWVIRAIDAGMPFDQFTIEQLAGDLLPEPTNAQLVATGFHRNTQINQEGGAKDEENRVNAVIDRLNTTGAVWLGTTLGCAQCHTHKYDPISHDDYYRMFAFFNQTADGGVSTGPRVAVTTPATAPQLAAFERERDRLLSALVDAEREAATGWSVWRPERMTASEGPELRLEEDGSISSVAHNPQTSLYELQGVTVGGLSAVRIEALPDLALRAHGPGRARDGSFELTRLRLFVRKVAEAALVEQSLLSVEPWRVLGPEGQPQVAVYRLEEPVDAQELRLELAQDFGDRHVLGRFRVSTTSGDVPRGGVTQEWREAWRRFAAHERQRPELPTTLVMKAQEPPRTTHLLRRGDFRDPGHVVEPRIPRALDTFQLESEVESRLDLARWLVRPQNALVHRVTVNRWWQRFFGLGLVATEGDFGVRGESPSHPELLEWLAREFVERNFSMKAIHRLIVTSKTYQQSSASRAELEQTDPRNRLLARQTRHRLDAEVIRDSALRASGLLSPEVGGPPVQPPQPDGVFKFTQTNKRWLADEGEGRFRRSLYTRLWRSSPFPFFATFDAPQPTVSCTRRIPSSTPLQALTLANDPMILEIAAGLGERVRRGAAGDDEGVRRAFERALSRPPSIDEARLLRDFLERQRQRGTEEAAWSAVARVLFNLDEFSHRS